MSYRFMRMLLMFDMPMVTATDKKSYRKFRKFLINEGFIMHQYSVYSKIVLNNTNKSAMLNRLRVNKPDKGLVTLLNVTEKQFSKMEYLRGERDTQVRNTDSRIVFLGGDQYDQTEL